MSAGSECLQTGMGAVSVKARRRQTAQAGLAYNTLTTSWLVFHPQCVQQMEGTLAVCAQILIPGQATSHARGFTLHHHRCSSVNMHHTPLHTYAMMVLCPYIQPPDYTHIHMLPCLSSLALSNNSLHSRIGFFLVCAQHTCVWLCVMTYVAPPYIETTLLVNTQCSTKGARSLAGQQKTHFELKLYIYSRKTHTKLMSAWLRKAHARLMND